MHIKPDIDIISFLKDVKKCESDVYFETLDGDSLVLSSALSQYIFCSIANTELLQNGQIRFADSADHDILTQYLC